jgi:hypothetical protein
VQPSERMAKVASIAALASRKAARLDEKRGIPKTSIPGKCIPESGIPETSIPSEGIPLSEPRERYFKVYNWVIDELAKRLAPAEFVVWLYIYRKTIGDRGTGKSCCEIGHTTLAAKLGMSKNAVINARKGLRSKGAIVEKQIDGQSTLAYCVIPPGIPSEGIPQKGIPDKDTPTVSDKGIPESGMPQEGIPKEDTLTMSDEGIPKKGILNIAPAQQANSGGIPKLGIPESARFTKDNNDSTKDNNILSLLKSEGVRVGEAKVDEWIQKGVTVKQLRKHIKVMRQNKARLENPTGWLIASIDEEWDLSDPTQAQLEALEAATASLDYLKGPRDEESIQQGLELVKLQNPWVVKG